jgi:hypothetical protein
MGVISMNIQLARFVGLPLIAVLFGCAPVSPAFQLKLDKTEEAAGLKKYTTLVVKDFENDAGEGVPSRVRQDLPEAVIAQLNECYPQAFEKITRKTSGSPEELVVSGTITEYDEGNRFARLMIAGRGSARLVVDVSLGDASGRELTRGEGRWVFAMGGLVGAAVGMGNLVQAAGSEIADGVAKTLGVKMAAKCSDPRSAR